MDNRSDKNGLGDPYEPSYKELMRKKYREDYDALPASVKRIADLAEFLTERHGWTGKEFV